jgi:hypothetical protein
MWAGLQLARRAAALVHLLAIGAASLVSPWASSIRALQSASSASEAILLAGEGAGRECQEQRPEPDQADRGGGLGAANVAEPAL